MNYELTQDGTAIRCLLCGMTSLNPSDVSHRYCARCHVFLDDFGDAVHPQPPFQPGERIMWQGNEYEVLSNEGLHGRVRDSEGRISYPFFWFGCGEFCRRL